MNFIKLSALTLSLVISLGVGSTTAFAEETSVSSSASISETIAHIEKALVEISKSDFNAAQVHLKAARTSAEKISGHEEIVKKANALVIQGQIIAKKGDIKSSSDELNKALELYKSL